MSRLKSFISKFKNFIVQKKNKRIILVFVIGFIVVFSILLFRSNPKYVDTRFGVKVPTFSEDPSQSGYFNSTESGPKFDLFNTDEDEIVSNDPDVIIVEDVSDPDAYKRSGIEGSGEAYPKKVSESLRNLMNEFYAAKLKAPSGEDIIYTNGVSSEIASTEREKIKGRVPLSIRGYTTPSGKQVNIFLSVLDSDGNDVVRIEVDGIDYNNNVIANSNPEMVAYLDAMVRAADEFKSMGADINNMHIKPGVRAYINTTAVSWLQFHGKFD
jgi:hypothetical protein